MFNYRLLLLAVILMMAACSPQTTPTPPPPTVEPTEMPESQPEPVHVLRLDSYHIEFPWSAEIGRGVVQGLKDAGYDVEQGNLVYEERFMDTKRNTSPEYFEQVAEETIAYIRETRPDILIVSDDNATRLVVQPMRDDGISFMILGLNGKPEDYELDNTPYVSGVLERPHVQEMTEWVEQVFGEDARMTILAEDSPTTDRMFGDGSTEATINESSIQLQGLTRTNDFAAWQEFVQNAPETADILFLGAYATLKDADGNAVEALDALHWTLENSAIPVMGFWEEAVHAGTLGGPVISGYNQGYEAATRAALVLEGTPAGDIPFSAPPRGKLILNRNAVDQWNVEVPINLLEVSEIVES